MYVHDLRMLFFDNKWSIVQAHECIRYERICHTLTLHTCYTHLFILLILISFGSTLFVHNPAYFLESNCFLVYTLNNA